MSRKSWSKLLSYFDMVNFAPDVKSPVIIGLGLRDYGLSPAPGIIAAYAYLPGHKALGVSPGWPLLPGGLLKARTLHRREVHRRTPVTIGERSDRREPHVRPRAA